MTRLVIDGAEMARLLRSPAGPVGRHLIGRAQVFQAAARAQAGRKTGCLGDSIVKRVEEGPEGFSIRVVCDTTPCSPSRTSYSLWHHDGTPPHIIAAKAGGWLAFDWPAGPSGGMFFARQVQHPGTVANKFFTDNLWLFGR